MSGAPLPRTSVSARKSHCTFFFSPEKLARSLTSASESASGEFVSTRRVLRYGGGRMAGLYCNLAIKVQLIQKMHLICSLLKKLSFKIIRRLASLLPGKTRRQSYITILFFFLAVKKSGKKIALTI